GPFNERWSGLRDLLPSETLAGALLACAILFMGLWPSPFVDRIADGLKGIPAVCPNQNCNVTPFGGSNARAAPMAGSYVDVRMAPLALPLPLTAVPTPATRVYTL